MTTLWLELYSQSGWANPFSDIKDESSFFALYFRSTKKDGNTGNPFKFSPHSLNMFMSFSLFYFQHRIRCVCDSSFHSKSVTGYVSQLWICCARLGIGRNSPWLGKCFYLSQHFKFASRGEISAEAEAFLFEKFFLIKLHNCICQPPQSKTICSRHKSLNRKLFSLSFLLFSASLWKLRRYGKESLRAWMLPFPFRSHCFVIIPSCCQKACMLNEQLREKK